MPHAVHKQVVHGTAQQKRVGLDVWQPIFRQFHLKVKSFCHAAVEKICGDLPQEDCRLQPLFAQRLHFTVQPHGQIQVVHQVSNDLTLRPNGRCLPLVLCCQVVRVL